MIEDDTPVVLRDVTKRFGATTAVQSVSWAPRRGQVTALVGLNGAGKSTLMRLMTGLITPTEGVVSVADRTGRALSALIESPALFAGLTVRRNLHIHRLLTGADPTETTAAADMAQIGHVLRHRVGALSQGYRQRAAIAVALLRSPDLLLLDEPTNALDPEAIVDLRHLIRTLADRGAAVVVSTHLLRELDGTADALTVLHEGRILYDGPFTSFVGSTSLRVRAVDTERTDQLVRALQASGVQVERRPDAIQVFPDSHTADLTARRVSTVAMASGIDLVELSHVTSTLEEAFHTTISGARR